MVLQSCFGDTLLRGTIANRTYRVWYTQKPIYFPIFTHKIWSYLLWPPVLLGIWLVCTQNGTAVLKESSGDNNDQNRIGCIPTRVGEERKGWVRSLSRRKKTTRHEPWWEGGGGGGGGGGGRIGEPAVWPRILGATILEGWERARRRANIALRETILLRGTIVNRTKYCR